MAVRSFSLACAVAATISPALAGTPMEAVRPFYDHTGLELDPAARDRFTDPALSVIAGDEALRQSGQGECLDAHMPQDGVGDEAEIMKTLKMAQAVDGDAAKVVVAFRFADAPHRLEWKLKLVGQDWKVADIISVSGEWALSQYGCQ